MRAADVERSFPLFVFEAGPWVLLFVLALLSSFAQTLATVAGIGVMLWGIFQGLFFAVEAAATACCLLLFVCALRRVWSRGDWLSLATDAAVLSGALFAIVLGASTFSLVMRAWGTDAWVQTSLLAIDAAPLYKALILLAVIAACAWVLDAFEMIVVVVPIIAPLLIVSLGDAQQAAVLLLMVLQMSFLLPPLGYAVVVLRPAGLVLRAIAYSTTSVSLPLQSKIPILGFSFGRFTSLSNASK